MYSMFFDLHIWWNLYSFTHKYSMVYCTVRFIFIGSKYQLNGFDFKLALYRLSAKCFSFSWFWVITWTMPLSKYCFLVLLGPPWIYTYGHYNNNPNGEVNLVKSAQHLAVELKIYLSSTVQRLMSVVGLPPTIRNKFVAPCKIQVWI